MNNIRFIISCFPEELITEIPTMGAHFKNCDSNRTPAWELCSCRKKLQDIIPHKLLYYLDDLAEQILKNKVVIDDNLRERQLLVETYNKIFQIYNKDFKLASYAIIKKDNHG